MPFFFVVGLELESLHPVNMLEIVVLAMGDASAAEQSPWTVSCVCASGKEVHLPSYDDADIAVQVDSGTLRAGSLSIREHMSWSSRLISLPVVSLPTQLATRPFGFDII